MNPPRTLIVGALVLIAFGFAVPATAGPEENKQLVRDFTTATNEADWGVLAMIVADDFMRHSAASPGPEVRSRDEFVNLQNGFLESFPDQQVTLHHLVSEGDYVAVRATYSGTQTGPMGDMPATGKTVESPFLAMIRIESGRIAEMWVEWDNLAMLGQLGLFPPPAAD